MSVHLAEVKDKNPRPDQVGYHLAEIPKGKFPEWSKVEEEWAEVADAMSQDNPLMLMQELSDLIGAIGGYTMSKWNISLKDLVKMSEATARAFQSGHRKTS